jgi:catechol 2,3-dioxygenase-like lactoylglutathione lyase family enzyme
MKLRVARHTTNLDIITRFYTEMLGLNVLGNFMGHDGYDGVFLGLPGAGWHLEFTASTELPIHQPDEDDLLVFYPETIVIYQQITARFKQAGIVEVTARNPYWNINGITYADPDGYRLVVVKVS